MTIDIKISHDLVPYRDAHTVMQNRVANIASGIATPLLWFLEHEPVYTAGTSAVTTDLLNTKITVEHIERGGKHTFHGPGQLIIYPIFNLLQIYSCKDKVDLRDFIKKIGNIMVNALEKSGVSNVYFDQDTIGIWHCDRNAQAKKIGFIGIRVRKYITFHGISLNILNQQSHFSHIRPCGLEPEYISSLEELGYCINKADLIKNLIDLFIAETL